MAVQQGSFDSDGVTLRYLDWGGDGPPLILIHATGFLAALWRPIAERLSARFRVVAMDQRGHGESDKPPDGYRFDVFADDLQRLIEALELESPIAAGHSSGGTTIVVHAARH
ncbi:MAG: alpha/beta hydrolase, partial [Chloroflexi bacterium]|nr:alpha/beta hydrolase [Chloroflexota bacterium]